MTTTESVRPIWPEESVQPARPCPVDELLDHARQIRVKVLKMVASAHAAHVGAALSIVDILTTLYFDVLNIDPNHADAPNRDRFILSKGHACSALYATLAERGFFAESVLSEFCADGGRLPGHPGMHCVPGVEVSSGSLGHGLSLGLGMAEAARADRRSSRTFVLVGDGETNEGAVWEAAMLAVARKLENLVVIIDLNGLQAFGRTAEVSGDVSLADKWRAFGWTVREASGHDPIALSSALGCVPFTPGRPSVVIAHTVKGSGVSFMEDRLEWHYRSPDAEQLAAALAEVMTR